MKIGIVTEYCYPASGGDHEPDHPVAEARRVDHDVAIATTSVWDRLASKPSRSAELRIGNQNRREEGAKCIGNSLRPFSGASIARTRQGLAGRRYHILTARLVEIYRFFPAGLASHKRVSVRS